MANPLTKIEKKIIKTKDVKPGEMHRMIKS